MLDKEILLHRKDNLLQLSQEYQNNGTINWNIFSSDQVANQKKVVLLMNDDFEHGTLRIQEPCLLKLGENISFNPNRPKKWLDSNGNVTTNFNAAEGIYENRIFDWMPHNDAPGNAQYFEQEVNFAYTLGFFAAIAIEAPYVILDLNGYKIEQHKEHYLQQRFFAIIELADQPFIPMQGPSNFGAILRTAKDVYIHNGTFGRSSHHGIHGNTNDGVFLENIVFENFEVAAIALNGAKNVLCQNVNVRNNKQDIPIVGTYSAARFCRFVAKSLINGGLGNGGLTTALRLLIKRLNMTFDAFIFGNGYIPKLFENKDGLIDGTAYGILFNPTGIAVNGFLATRDTPKANEANNICMENTSINDIKSSINEIVAIGNDSGAAQVGPVGSILQFYNYVSDLRNGKYFYKGTSLSDVKIEIAKIKQNLIEQNNPAKSSKLFGTINISKGVQMWYDNPHLYFKPINGGKLQLYNNNTNSPVLINGMHVVHNIICNGDTMFHVNKGTIGIRMDGCNGALLDNCMVTNIVGEGALGSTLAGNYIKSHPLQTNMIGYHGNNVYGAILCAVNDVTINNLNVIDIDSSTGYAKGLAILNESTNCTVSNLTVKNISCGIDMEITPQLSLLPNKLPIATGLNTGHDVSNITFHNVQVSNVVNNQNVPYNKPYDINGDITIE